MALPSKQSPQVSNYEMSFSSTPVSASHIVDLRGGGSPLSILMHLESKDISYSLSLSQCLEEYLVHSRCTGQKRKYEKKKRKVEEKKE